MKTRESAFTRFPLSLAIAAVSAAASAPARADDSVVDWNALTTELLSALWLENVWANPPLAGADVQAEVQAMIEEHYQVAMASIEDGGAKMAGMMIGSACACANLALRADDGIAAAGPPFSPPFSTTSASLPGVTHHFDSFSQAATENGMSRVYCGIHFVQAVSAGHGLGRSIGREISGMLNRLPSH